jgi:hypothetical protein
MKKVIIAMLFIPTLSFGMLRGPQLQVSNWISRQVNRLANRYAKWRHSPVKPSESLSGEEEQLRLKLEHVQSKRKNLFYGDSSTVWHEQARQKRLLESAKKRLNQDRLIDKIFPQLKAHRTKVAKFDIEYANKNLDRLYDQAQQNSARDFEFKKSQYYLQDLLFDIEKKKYK